MKNKIKKLLWDYKHGKPDRKSGLTLEVYDTDDVLNELKKWILTKKRKSDYYNKRGIYGNGGHCSTYDHVEIYNEAIDNIIKEIKNNE